AGIGGDGRGVGHASAYAGMRDVEVAAICDVDASVVAGAMDAVEKHGRPRPAYVQDLRRLMEDKDIDAVSIATCNHWHALAAIWACQAGKDVYVEKPASHNIWEGRKMMEAARKYNRMVQVGMQSRTTDHKIRAMQMLHDGVIGK